MLERWVMRGTSCSLWLSLFLFSTWMGCQTAPPGGYGRVVQFTPSRAEVNENDLARGLRVSFDRPVGPAAEYSLATGSCR